MEVISQLHAPADLLPVKVSAEPVSRMPNGKSDRDSTGHRRKNSLPLPQSKSQSSSL